MNRLIYCSLMLGIAGLAFTGCDRPNQNQPVSDKTTVKAASAGASPAATAAAPGANAEVTGRDDQNPLSMSTAATQQSPTATPAAAAIAIDIAPPTAEQLTKWTPAPFTPVELLAVCEAPKTSFTSHIAALPDGKHFVAVGSRVLLWSVNGQEPEHIFLDLTTDDGDRHQLSLAVAPDGTWFAAGDSEGMVRIWNVADRKELVAKTLGATGIRDLAISPDGSQIATISYDSVIFVWNAADLAPLKSFKVDFSGMERIHYMAPDQLVAAGESTSLWNTATGKRERELSPGRYSFALARSPDDAQLIFGGRDLLHLWNVVEAKDDAQITKHVSGSELLAYSPDGKFLVTTNRRSVLLWNLAERRIVQVIDSFGWPIADLAWLPETNLLVVASDIGLTRVWGTPEQGAAVGLKPLHTPLAAVQSAPQQASRTPATVSQLEQVIDLRTLPQLPECETQLFGRHDFSCDTTASTAEINSFYRHFLEGQGWKLTKATTAPATQLEFAKQGLRLSVQCYGSGQGKINVNVHHDGGYDARWLPKFDGAPVEISLDAPNMTSYSTKADLLSIETSLLRKMHAAGWTGYARLKSSHGEEPDARNLDFVRPGATLRVSIGRFPVAPTSYTIQHTLFLEDYSAPIPPDSGFVEYDNSTEPTLVALTKMSLAEACDFYDQALAADGWLVDERRRSVKDEHVWLAYLRNQSNLTVGLTKLDDGRTLVEIGDTGLSLWKAAQTKNDPSAETSTDSAASAGLQAADLPVLGESSIATYDAVGDRVEIAMEKTTLAAAAEQYAKALVKLGWELQDGGIRDEDYTLLRFEKDKNEVTLRGRLQAGKAQLSFDGLLWEKELPGPKQIVSFETWLRLNHHPASLDLLDEYQAEMQALTVKE